MPLSVDNIMQSKSGSFDGTSGTASLDSATTAGTMIVLITSLGIAGSGSPAYQVTPPAGFTPIGGNELNEVAGTTTTRKVDVLLSAKRNGAGGETSWTLDMLNGNGTQVCWTVLEIEGAGVDPLETWYVSTTAATSLYDGGTPSTIGTGPTIASSCFDVLAISVHAARSNDTTVVTWSGQTDGFTEFGEVSQVNATNALSMVVSYKPSLALGTFSSTATLSTGSPACGAVIVLYADSAKHAPNLRAIFGAEIGTGDGLTAGGADANGFNSFAPWASSAGAPEIVTAHPRTGSYAMKLSSSAAAEWVAWNNPGTLNNGAFTAHVGRVWTGRVCFYFETSLPSADVELFSVEAGSAANGFVCWFRNGTSKIAMKSGTGTEIASDATVAAGQYIAVDYRYDTRNATHTLDWQVDYNADPADTTAPVAQTQATGGGTSAATISEVVVGWKSARSATVFYDDIAGGWSWGMYPIGDLRITPVKVDTAGTATVSGTSGNFRTFTSNGTLAAWTSAGTLNALDDIPPAIGATSDGLAQITVATSDYVEVPMATFTAAPTNTLRALRWYIAGWAASGNPGTLGCTSWDGSQSYTIGAGSSDHGFDDSTTRWIVAMQTNSGGDAWKNFYLLSQTKMDAMAVRTGFSNDANPDVGIHCILAEVAYQPATSIGLFEAEGGAFNVYGRLDPSSSAIVSLLATTPAGTRGGTLTWTAGGSDGSQYVGPNTTYEKTFTSSSIEDVTSYGFSPDPG